MRRSLSSIALLALIWPMQLHADLINDLVDLQGLIEGRCGPRFMVVWVDDSGAIPPCMLSYSFGCEEIQASGEASCPLARPPEPDPVQTSAVAR
ncbi:hypothetical protein [Chitinolyticbacter meiyuanensis]|uniref:hypothetical protein n=1 Tax=Chitinolyticbacter meiyuanensis TaxID=682798 RepID=UPI0011E6042D|nr:hypothetical protein [Chitinolyticbacter meiyuanensis]